MYTVLAVLPPPGVRMFRLFRVGANSCHPWELLLGSEAVALIIVQEEAGTSIQCCSSR